MIAHRRELRPIQLQEELDAVEKLRALKNQGVKEGERPTPNGERIPKKSGGILCEGVEVKYACIRENRDSWPVTMMCRLLRVSTSGYYASLTRQPNRAEVKRELVARVASEIYQEEHRIPGYRKIHRKVCIQGTKCGVETVRLACRRAGIVSCVVKRKYRPKTTDSKHRHRINKNVLARNFKAEKPNEKWLTDITYIETKSGFCYLSAIIDLFSRRVIGWCIESHMRTEMVVETLYY